MGALIIILLVLIFFSGKKPFKALQTDDITKVEVLALPPDTRKDISDNTQIQKLVEILNNVVVYNKDDSWQEYVGQYIQFSITTKNGEIITVATYNPFLIIDNVGYRAKYKSLVDLNALANSIMILSLR